MRFGKNVLSQYLRTGCDLALYLTLFTDRELESAGLPTPLEARPGVGTLRDAGFEQEALIFSRLEQGFGCRCLGERPVRAGDRWGHQPLEEQLDAATDLPCILIQPKFDLEGGRNAALSHLGVAAEDLALMPRFEGFIPDVAIVEAPAIGMYKLTATGDRLPVSEGESRLSIALVDVKHAQQANPSYEAEVALYGILLANWLVNNGLDQRFFVNSELCLWTGGGTRQDTFQQALATGTSEPSLLLQAMRTELSSINLPIYVQAIRRFFAERLPRVIRIGRDDWTELDWHVGPKCASCDWLGFEGWLGARDRSKVAANPCYYCVSRASYEDHLSRLPLITHGSRRVLEAEGFQTVNQVAATTGTESVYALHTKLKADRRSIPGFANAIVSSVPSIDPDRPDGMLARYADLDVFLCVNFDPGSGLLTGLGLQASFRQPSPSNQAPDERANQRWRERWVVSAKSSEAEEGTLLAFLQYLATIFEFVTNTEPSRGGPSAGETRAQIIFWDRRQFEELCLAMGRHLPAILYDRQDRLVRALAWIFPPEELQETDTIDERRPAISFIRDVVRRLIRVPAIHALTLFNVAEHYHYHDTSLRAPDQFYREPLSDTIPRERIYEIWQLSANGGRGVIRWGNVVKTQSQLVEGFARAIDAQGFALSSITWRLRRDFNRRLKAEAPRIRLVVPNWALNVAHDSKLWIAWAKFENAFGKAASHMLFLADPDEIEATHEGLRLTRVIRERPDGTLECEVSPGSLNTKLRAPQEFLCLSVDALAGFLAMPAWAVVAPAHLPAELSRLNNVQMHKVFGAKLEHFDRANLTATVRLANFWGRNAADFYHLRQQIVHLLGSALQSNLTLVPGLGSDVQVNRLVNILEAVGTPPNAVAAPETFVALGAVNRRPRRGNDVITPISRVLWEASALHATQLRPSLAVDRIAAIARARAALNHSQTNAVREAARRALTVIWGPPGTGKTKTCCGLLQGIIVHEAQISRQRPYAILLTGPTYKAVGELVGRLSSDLAVDSEARCLLYLVHSASRDDRFPTPDQHGEHLCITATFADADSPEFSSMGSDLERGDHIVIVAAVTHQCSRIAEQLAKLRQAQGQVLWPLFDVVLVDESSQVDMTTAVGPLALLKPISQLIVAGDHLQMPPVIQTDPPVGAEHLVGSLQTYLTKRFSLTSCPLLENYRSNKDIVDYTRRLGYPAGLAAANPGTQIKLLRPIQELSESLIAAGLPWSDFWPGALDPTRPIAAITYPDGMAGQANVFEAECAASLVWLLRYCGSRALDGQPGQPPHAEWDDESFWRKGIGVVTPHRAQRAQVVQTLLRIFPETNADLIDGAVDTVERFQGGERHTILISFGVGDPDVIRGEERFLMQLERTNVAISRAMGKCILLMSEEVANHIPDDRKAAASAFALRGIVDEWCITRESGLAKMAENNLRPLTLRWR